MEGIKRVYLHIPIDDENFSVNSKAYYLNEKGINFAKDKDYVAALKSFLDADKELPNNDAIQNNLQLCFKILDELNKGFWELVHN